MKNLLLLVSLFCCVQLIGQSDCIDPDLIDPDGACFDVWEPVCGCDSVTYSNACYAEVFNGVTSWTPGECSSGVGECPELEPGLDFGLCATIIGVALVDGQCIGISGCSTVASNGTDYAAYFYNSIDECNACAETIGCINTSQIDTSAGCFTVYDPVCGCDNETYNNSCEAYYYGGVTSWIPGECGNPDDCPELPAGLDFGPCDAIVGLAQVNNECVVISGCGPVASDGVDYSAYFYNDESDCQSCLNGGDCINESQIDSTAFCIEIYDPVCGCDSVTYDNSCFAYNYGGVTSWTPGVCGSLNECPQLDPTLDFGDCTAVIGTALIDGNCVGVSGCGTVASDGVDYEAYFYEDAEDCLACTDSVECVNPDQIDLEFPCTEELDPVCGCDGETYSNDCHAFYYGGVTSWTDGECGGVVPCTDVDGVDFGPCDLFLGYAVLDGQCTGVSGCGTLGPDSVDYSNAFFDSLEDCQDCFGCINPDQIDEGFACTDEYDPVCGCDSVTYSNDCYAYYYGGVTSWTPGECVNTGIADHNQIVDVQFIRGQYVRLRTDAAIESMILYDLGGKTIWQKGQISPGEHEILLPIDQMGIYLYRIQLKDQVQTGKVLMH